MSVAPKRAASSFLYFANAMRPKLREENPTLPVTEIAKALGKLWRGLDDKDKAPYVSLAADDRKRYREEMSTYTPPPNGQKKKKKKKGKAKPKRDPAHPRAPTTSFMYFANETRPATRAANPELKITEIAKVLGGMWRNLGDADKVTFFDKARVDRERYHAEMKKYTPPSASASSSSSSSSSSSTSSSSSSDSS